ncbi:hypothetical protein SAMN04515692_1316 [Leifsonia sp. CL147]|nr:hypothetical protein SAMN04515694_1326 [Leifsonia sp. CL154]SFM11292.1 hypothetical protein SAMN04515692_1316 [Leifsonia sp. CL147]
MIAHPGAWAAGLWQQVTATVRQIADGNAYVDGQLAGEIASVLIPGMAATKIARAGSLLKTAGELGPVTRLTAAQQTLVDQLINAGVKVSSEKIVTIIKTPEGRIVWLEEGMTKEMAAPGGASGLAHIIEDHGGQFTQKGISEAEIPEVLTKAIQTGKVIRYQAKEPEPAAGLRIRVRGKDPQAFNHNRKQQLHRRSEFRIMNDFIITLPVLEPDLPPCVDIHYEWTQFAVWLSGKYGVGNPVEGHEIGLSSELVHDLLVWTDAADALFNADDPPNGLLPANFYEDGFELAKRVRAELPAEWIVTAYHPVSRTRVVLPLRD